MPLVPQQRRADDPGPQRIPQPIDIRAALTGLARDNQVQDLVLDHLLAALLPNLPHPDRYDLWHTLVDQLPHLDSHDGDRHENAAHAINHAFTAAHLAPEHHRGRP